ncbi:MAG: hypothetical protein LBD02_01155 [Christensenellaceae bacterium]|nr:hypothetical protein [Christensenellaceae bacterium]
MGIKRREPLAHRIHLRVPPTKALRSGVYWRVRIPAHSNQIFATAALVNLRATNNYIAACFYIATCDDVPKPTFGLLNKGLHGFLSPFAAPANQGRNHHPDRADDCHNPPTKTECPSIHFKISMPYTSAPVIGFFFTIPV